MIRHQRCLWKCHEKMKTERPIWLILPVVICFFQGLSHANVSGLGVSRGDCVRLIKRLIVYPTEGAHVLSDGITALTGQLIPGRQILCHPTTFGVKPGSGVKDAIGRNKDQRHQQWWQMQLLTQANVAEASWASTS